MTPVKDWQMLTVADLGRVVTGKTPPTVKHNLYGEGYPFITPTDIGDFRFCKTARQISEEGRASQRNLLLPPHSVCVTCIASVGKMCMTTRPSFTNQQINSVIVDETQHNPFFIYYLLRSRVAHLKAIASGAATPIINKTAFSEIEVCVPRLPVQRRIAGILSGYDELIENSQRRIEILETMARLLYREWFVQFRFPGHEKVPHVASSLGNIPKGWEIKPVKEILARRSAGTAYREADLKPEGVTPVLDQSTNELLGFHDNEPDHFASPTKPMAIFGDHTCKMQLLIEPFSIGPNVVPFVAAQNLPTAYAFYAVNSLVQTQEYKRHWIPLNANEIVVADGEVVHRFASLIQPMLIAQEILRKVVRKLRRTRDLLLPRLLSGQVVLDDFASILDED